MVGRCYFQRHYRETFHEKLQSSIPISLFTNLLCSIWYIIIGSDNDLVLNTQQALPKPVIVQSIDWYACFPGFSYSLVLMDVYDPPNTKSIPLFFKVLLPVWWRHQMETFPRYWPFVKGIHWSPVNSPYKDQWCWALMFSLICAWINGGVSNRDAGDLRPHRAHYDVFVMAYRTRRNEFQ